MKAWQITAPSKIEEISKVDSFESVSAVKVKITKALVSDNDVLAYLGDLELDYPLIPGRIAVGVIVETCGVCLLDMEKNQRVYVNPIASCGECYNCVSGNKNACSDFHIAGETKDGYFKDFATLDCNKLYPLPQSVEDNEALFIEHISLAISIIDKLNISKGDHVSIIGGGTLGNLLAQLIIYYQGVPILIDKDEENLAIAQKSGIYYTLKTDAQLSKTVSDLTGGRMTEKTVYITDCALNTRLPFSLTSYGGKIAFAGFNIKNIKIDFSVAIKKALTTVGITDGFGQTEASINLLANKAVNLSAFNFEHTNFNGIPKTLELGAKKLAAGEKRADTIVNMI